jgi:hypothetical protein
MFSRNHTDPRVKNTILIVAIVLAGAALVYVLYACTVIRNKSGDVGTLAPYSTIVGKELALLRPMILVALNNKGMYQEHPHHLVEESAARAEWESILGTLPAGSKLRINKAMHIKNATSGVTTSLIVGQVTFGSPAREITFEYAWGRQRENVSVPAAERWWTFPLAPWQSEPISEKFVFDEL